MQFVNLLFNIMDKDGRAGKNNVKHLSTLPKFIATSTIYHCPWCCTPHTRIKRI